MFDQKVTSELSERGKNKNTQGIWGIVYDKAQVHHSEITAAGSNYASYYETAKLLCHILPSTAAAATQNAATSGCIKEHNQWLIYECKVKIFSIAFSVISLWVVVHGQNTPVQSAEAGRQQRRELTEADRVT